MSKIVSVMQCTVVAFRRDATGLVQRARGVECCEVEHCPGRLGGRGYGR